MLVTFLTSSSSSQLTCGSFSPDVSHDNTENNVSSDMNDPVQGRSTEGVEPSRETATEPQRQRGRGRGGNKRGNPRPNRQQQQQLDPNAPPFEGQPQAPPGQQPQQAKPKRNRNPAPRGRGRGQRVFRVFRDEGASNYYQGSNGEHFEEQQQQNNPPRNRRGRYNADPNPRRGRGRCYNNRRDYQDNEVAQPPPLLSQDVRYGGEQQDRNRNPPQTPRRYNKPVYDAQSSVEVGQRERLIQQLTNAQYECMVCLEKVRQVHAIWDCGSCYVVFHMHCLKKWSKTTRDDSGTWNCPACRGAHPFAPREYRCFCRKTRDPDWNRGWDTPHSCGDICSKRRDCAHACAELCHPGPCPPCEASVKSVCPCGASSQFGRCGTALMCDNICGKTRNCGVHQCDKKCHEGECGDCEEMVEQACFCGNHSQSPLCTSETSLIRFYPCGGVCGKQLDCENHTCKQKCHEGSCSPCQLTPSIVLSCSCGQTPLAKMAERDGTDERRSCLDKIPTCGLVCDKGLGCGKRGDEHTCQANCHSGSCPSCPLVTPVRCRCGFMSDKEVACMKLKGMHADTENQENEDEGPRPSLSDDVLCEKRCQKKRLCGRHKCNERCCITIDHVCPLICDKQLACGKHRCEDPCHKGNCQPCPHVSFDELHCRCGTMSLFPPIACNTRPPFCEQPCNRPHSCQHQVLHSCHADPVCPPCTALVEKWCWGNHEVRKSVACHVVGLSCGHPCSRPLPCGRHKCIRDCHDGNCLTSAQAAQVVCGQKCSAKRETCVHACAAPCHEGACPETNCKQKIKVLCQCGHLSALRLCGDQTSEYKRLHMAQLMSGTYALPMNGSNNNNSKLLPCNEECALLERNRRLALALQIENPDQASKLAAPKYSEFMREWGRKDAAFVLNVHDKLSDLVKLAKDSKQRSRSYSFDVMNRDRRQLIHEYSDHFGVDSESFDAEPHRNVIATAVPEKVWIPSQSLMDVVAGQRRAWNGASMTSLTAVKSSSGPSLSQLSPLRRVAAQPAPKPKPAAGPAIDYFDFDD